VNLENHIGPCPHQGLVAPFELSAAKILGAEVLRLQHCPGGAVQHQDPLAHERAQLGCPVGAGGDEVSAGC